MQGVILVIDDAKTITSFIEKILTKEGYTVYKDGSGAEGLKLAQEVNPDLIFMDIVMPDMDGYATTTELKKIDKLKEVPVVFLSGCSENEDGGKSFAAGGSSYMRKPFTDKQLRDFVRLAMMSIVKG